MSIKPRDHKTQVVQGMCLKCFHLYLDEKADTFACAEYRELITGCVERCPGYLSVGEGISELVDKMRALGELPPAENKVDATIEAPEF